MRAPPQTAAPAPAPPPEVSIPTPPQGDRRPEQHTASSPPASPPAPPFIHATIDPDEYVRRFPPPEPPHRFVASRVARGFLFAVALMAAGAIGAFGALWIEESGGAHRRTGQTAIRLAQEPGTPAETSSGDSGAQAEQDSEPGAPAEAPSKSVPSKTAKSEEQSVKTVKPPKKAPSTAQKIARGREISRIQQQAADELKKKTRNRRTASVASAKAVPKAASKLARQASPRRTEKESEQRSTQLQRIRQVLTRCEKIDNLFRREQCKWRVCEGRWGKNGCPSYVKNKVALD